MLRDDGTFRIFLIQFSSDGKDWHQAGETLMANIPEEMRFIDPKIAKHTPLFEEWFDTWQITGHHGWTNRQSVFAVLYLMAEHTPKYRFRVIQRDFSQETKILGEAHIPQETT